MKILIIAATPHELKHIIESGRVDDNINILLTGVGMIEASITASAHLVHNIYDLIIHAGIAGAIDRSLKLGELIAIKKDNLYELGAENHHEFLTLDKLYLEQYAVSTICIKSIYELNIKNVNAITVNTVHGSSESIHTLRGRSDAQIETMEGFAIARVCQLFALPLVSLRAISNYVEPRNRDNWQIEKAIINLNEFILHFLSRYAKN